MDFKDNWKQCRKLPWLPVWRADPAEGLKNIGVPRKRIPPACRDVDHAQVDSRQGLGSGDPLGAIERPTPVTLQSCFGISTAHQGRAVAFRLAPCRRGLCVQEPGGRAHIPHIFMGGYPRYLKPAHRWPQSGNRKGQWPHATQVWPYPARTQGIRIGGAPGNARALPALADLLSGRRP